MNIDTNDLKEKLLSISPFDVNKVFAILDEIGSQNPGLFDKVSLYLNRNHSIDTFCNPIIVQITCYAYNRKLDWISALTELLDIIKNQTGFIELPKREIIEVEIINTDLFEGVKVEKAMLANGKIIQTGDIIELSDKIGDDYKKTIYFDAFLPCPDWSLFYPNEESFQFVNFYFKANHLIYREVKPFTFGRVPRIFSNTFAKIESIYSTEKGIFAYTGFYRIEIEKAFKAHEIVVVDKISENSKITNLDWLMENIGSTAAGLRPETYREIIIQIGISDFKYLQKNWYRYRYSLGKSCWHEIADFGKTVPIIPPDFWKNNV